MLCVDMDLIDLAKIAKERYLYIQIVFMTSESIPVYLTMLLEHTHLSNIVSRDEGDRSFTLNNNLTTVSKLLNQDFFGLETYLSW